MKEDKRKNNRGATGRTWKKKNPIGGKNRTLRISDELWEGICPSKTGQSRTKFICHSIESQLNNINK